jgi:hypothetical protein
MPANREIMFYACTGINARPIPNVSKAKRAGVWLKWKNTSLAKAKALSSKEVC